MRCTSNAPDLSSLSERVSEIVSTAILSGTNCLDSSRPAISVRLYWTRHFRPACAPFEARSLGRLPRPRPVAAGYRSKRDIEPVGAVDRHDRQREVGKFPLVELRAGELIDRIGDMAFGDARDRLGPCQSGAFARAIKRRLLPGVEQIKALLAFAGGAQLLGVHVDAMRAAVDLRGTQLHQLEQRMVETATVDEGVELADRLGPFRRG